MTGPIQHTSLLPPRTLYVLNSTIHRQDRLGFYASLYSRYADASPSEEAF